MTDEERLAEARAILADTNRGFGPKIRGVDIVAQAVAAALAKRDAEIERLHKEIVIAEKDGFNAGVDAWKNASGLVDTLMGKQQKSCVDRAEFALQQMLYGLCIGPHNRESVRSYLASQFEYERDAAIREGRQQMREEAQEFIQRHANAPKGGWIKHRQTLLNIAALLDFIPDDPPTQEPSQ